jgi:hypothetical protein
MTGFDNHGDPSRIEDICKRLSYLLCKAFLELKTTGEHLSDASEFRDADDTVSRHVANVHLSEVSAGFLVGLEIHTLPVNGTRWCSHNEKISMSRTMTSSS